ncbi:hypothetical protein CR513_48442, partial [Mucuna pruriens]
MPDKSPTLAQQYFVKEKEDKRDKDVSPVEVKDVENPKEAASKGAAVEKASEETPAVADESSEVNPPAEQSTNPTSDTSEVSNDATTEQSSGNTEEENVGGDQEAAKEGPQIEISDSNYKPNKALCVAAKGEGAPECDKFAKYTVLFALVNGLTDGMSKGKMEHSQDRSRLRLSKIVDQIHLFLSHTYPYSAEIKTLNPLRDVN